jgi:hypothetical protein
VEEAVSGDRAGREEAVSADRGDGGGSGEWDRA